MGCANVYSILLESGVLASGQNIRETEIFRRSLELGLISIPDESPEPVISAPAAGSPATAAEAVYQISGMWCSACAWLIEHALRRLPGVESAEVFFASDLARVRYRPQSLPPDRIVARIAEVGYRATRYGPENTSAQQETRDLVLRLGVAAFLWANIMAFSTILYVGYFEQIAASASRNLPIILFVLATPLVFYCAFPILRTAAIGMRQLQVRMETLLALGILTAYFFSVAQTFLHRPHLYFDTAAAIVTLVLTGKLIERRAKERAARSIANLYRMMPRKARLESDAGDRFVAIEALEPGAIFISKTGERIPADGVIIEGETDVDEALLTGESAPVRKRPGDTVISGSLNAGNLIKVRALRTSESSVLVQIVRLVERALASRAPIERTVDSLARIFVPAVVVFAVGVFAVMILMHGGAGVALMRATTILVIACPCALGLATPLAITAAIGNASSKGLLIADSRVLETMSSVDTLILDKTGTITHGDFRLVAFDLLEPAGDLHGTFLREYLPILAGIELCSERLLGRAVVRYAREHGVRPAEISSISVHKGMGITATYQGRAIFVGNHALAREAAGELDPAMAARASEWQQYGHTVSFFGFGDQVCGVLAFGDQVKPGAAQMVQRFRDRGVSVRLVSGDARLSTQFVARQVGIEDFTSEALPEDKVRIIRELQQQGFRVAIVGDGVNDAPALAQADLGVALGTGADIAMSAAPVVLMSGVLSHLDDAFSLASTARRVIRQNLFWAFFYNIVGVSLAVTGLLSPIMAAGAMLLSSTCVVANSMRLTRDNGNTA
jgi:heavy metal translocating P-type ATPase